MGKRSKRNRRNAPPQRPSSVAAAAPPPPAAAPPVAAAAAAATSSVMREALSLASTSVRDGIKIAVVGDSASGFYIYSYNHGNGRPEYFVDNVPVDKKENVAKTIYWLANLENVGHRHSIRGHGNLFFWLNQVEGETKDSLLRHKCFYMNHFSKGAPIYELRPLFECSITEDWWGSRPPAPNAQETIVDEILIAWEQQRHFTVETVCPVSDYGDRLIYLMREIFHDVDEVGLENMYVPRKKHVDLAVALKHVDDWKVDWDEKLNEEQILFVKEHAKYFRYIARVLFRDRPICQHCGALGKHLKVCTRCKSTMYCGRDCQLADLKSHKKHCNGRTEMRNQKLCVKPLQTFH